MEDTENVVNEETTETTTTETAEAEVEVDTDTGEAEAEDTDTDTDTDTGTDTEDEYESIWDRLAKALEEPEDESAEADSDTDTDTDTEEGGVDTSEEADAEGEDSAGEEDAAEYTDTSAAEDMATINERFGTKYTSIEQIPNYERFTELRAKYSLSAEEAFGAVTVSKRKAVPPSKAHQTPATPTRKAPKPSATETEIRDTAELLGVSRAEALKYIERAKRLKFDY